MSDLEDRLKEALAQAAHGLFASAPAKAKEWDNLSEDMRTKYREQFAAPLVAGILPVVQEVEAGAAQIAEDGRKAVQRLIDADATIARVRDRANGHAASINGIRADILDIIDGGDQ